MTRLSSVARRFASARKLSLMLKRAPLHTRAKRKSGREIRYRLMPHAFITVSSLLFVSRPTVTSVATRAEMGRT